MRYLRPILIVLLLFFAKSVTHAQCTDQFTFKAFSADKHTENGKIEVRVKNKGFGNYTFKLYKVEGPIELLQTLEAQAPEKITFEGLAPSNYYIKIEWGSCQKTIGGIEGIFITEKAQDK